MTSQSSSTVPAEEPSAAPERWETDPTTQLRALREEVSRQLNFPSAHTRAFMAAAFEALERLPAEYFPRERAQALIDISRFYYLDGDVKQALRTASEAVRSAVLGGHRGLESRARSRHAISLRSTYDFVASMSEMALALEIAREQMDAEWEAKVLNNLGNSYSDAGLYTEAIAIFQQVAAFFESTKDYVAAWMAFDNAALAALRLGDVQRGVIFAEKAKATWSGEALTSNERLWVVQGAITNCQLLIEADRVEEAGACARAARAMANLSGLGGAISLAEIAEAICAFSAGVAGTDAIDRVIAMARDDSPNLYWCALDAAIRTYERAGRLDEALTLQRRLLAFNREHKFEEVRRTWGRPSLEESEAAAKLAYLGKAVDRRVGDLINMAVTQALRAGHDHARIFRVSRLAELFTTSEAWPQERVYLVALAAKMIDVGMMVIPNDLLTKAQKLSDGERKVVEEHCKFGAEVLASARLALLEPCAPIVRFHHERWDGTGPCMLKGESIPLEARTVALCDCFDALTHARPWREALSVPAALRTIGEEVGSCFDPSLSKRFIAWVQTEFWKADDFEAYLSAEALENGYVRTRERIQHLIRTAP